MRAEVSEALAAYGAAWHPYGGAGKASNLCPPPVSLYSAPISPVGGLVHSAKGKMVSRSGGRGKRDCGRGRALGKSVSLFPDVATAGSRKVVVGCAFAGKGGKKKPFCKLLLLWRYAGEEGTGFRGNKNRAALKGS